MAQQSRPLLLGGLITDNKYVGNFFLLDRQHPNPKLREVAERVLDQIGGFSKKQQAALPRFIPLMVELKGDDDTRDLHRAMYEGVAKHIQTVFPAVAAQIRAHLTALGYGDYRPADVILQEKADEEEAKRTERVTPAPATRKQRTPPPEEEVTEDGASIVQEEGEESQAEPDDQPAEEGIPDDEALPQPAENGDYWRQGPAPVQRGRPRVSTPEVQIEDRGGKAIKGRVVRVDRGR